MDNIQNLEVYYKPVGKNYGWQLDNLTTAHTGPIFGGRTISAMGNRPQDHRDRDLLLASLLRDKRLPMFREQCFNLPAWAPAVPECIPATFQHQAQQLTVLGSTHQHFIERMRASIHLAADPGKAEQMLKAMEACPPRGALFARTPLDTAHPCGHARLCPWCHARSVQRLYDQLQAGSCTAERLAGKHLILLRIRVEAGRELQASEVREAAKVYRYQLRRLANRIGIEGGAIIHQVTPWMPHYDRPSEKRKIFAHVFAMVGVVGRSDIDSVDRATSTFCDDQMLGGDYELMMLSATNPQALRFLLHGTSHKFDLSELGLLVKNPKTVLFGVQGAAALQPWFMFSEQQAWCYESAMQGTRLFDTFGSWRVAKAEQKSCPKQPLTKSEDLNELRQGACEGDNFHKQCVAKERRRELAVIALPLFQKFKDAGGKQLGSPALRKMLNEAGHNISDRDARWLAKNLPSMDKRTVREKAFAVWTLHKARCQERLEQACIQTAE
jgi:hypothetical protein